MAAQECQHSGYRVPYIWSRVRLVRVRISRLLLTLPGSTPGFDTVYGRWRDASWVALCYGAGSCVLVSARSLPTICVLLGIPMADVNQARTTLRHPLTMAAGSVIMCSLMVTTSTLHRTALGVKKYKKPRDASLRAGLFLAHSLSFKSDTHDGYGLTMRRRIDILCP